MWAAGRASVAIVAAAVLCGACAGKNASPEGADSTGDAAELVVENNKWLDVNVYALRSGTRVRLGTVTSLQTERFRLPSWVMTGSSDLRLVIDPVGSGQSHTTQPILVSPGARIIFKVADYLPLSAYSVLVADRR
jgi:hypothetical protein